MEHQHPTSGSRNDARYLRPVVSSYFRSILEHYNTAIARYHAQPAGPKPLFGSVDGRLVKYNSNGTDNDQGEEYYTFPGYGDGFDLSSFPVCPLCRRPFNDGPNPQYFSFLHDLFLRKNALPSRPPSPSPKPRDIDQSESPFPTSPEPTVTTPTMNGTPNTDYNKDQEDKEKLNEECNGYYFTDDEISVTKNDDVHRSTNEEMKGNTSNNNNNNNNSSQKVDSELSTSKTSNSISSKSQLNQTYSSLDTDCIIDGYYNRFFKEVRVLGSGSFGDVYLVEHIISGMVVGEYALKRVAVGDSIEWLSAALKEVTSLESICHPNVLSYKHCWVENSQFNKWSPRVPFLFILTGLADAGSLDVLINIYSRNPTSKNINIKGKRNENEPRINNVHYMNPIHAAIIFRGAARGLAHLHRLGMLHRDIKPSNILLMRDKSEGGIGLRALLGDLAQCMRADCLPPNHTGATGTIGYAAPEVQNGGMCSYESDVYALGVSLGELLSVCEASEDEDSVYQSLKRLEATMTSKDPLQRPTSQSVAVQLKMISKSK